MFDPCGWAQALGYVMGVSLPSLYKEVLQGLGSRVGTASVNMFSEAVGGWEW